ncbi:MAG: inositol monophosphatase family protein [Alphaproteobacteria bacterium]|nr:inositol monophosphatase family protein [Alphaproteobacteria bacterium]
MSQSPLINVMSGAAIKAGKGLLRDFSEVDHLQVSRKGTSNFVTQADLKTEKLLHRELSKARPDFGFLMEESGEMPGKKDEFRFIIDPLDGTTNFIHATAYFCISIAVEQRYRNGDTEIIAGVIFDPINNELFTAEKGKGAFVNSRRMLVSGRDKLEDAMLVTGGLRGSPKERYSPSLLSVIHECGATMRIFGATALDLAHLAAGRIDACWYYSIKPWDIAAGALMVQEAGGLVSDLSGSTLTMDSNGLVASNKHLNDPVKKLLSKHV